MDEELAEERIVGKSEGEGKKKDSRRQPILSVFTELFIKSLIDIHDYQKRSALAQRKHMYCFDKESRGRSMRRERV